MLPSDDAHSIREFVRACRAVVRDVTDRSGPAEFPPTHVRILLEIGGRPPVTVVELRAALGIDAGQLSRALGRLQAGGAVRVMRCADDRRRRVVELTDFGRRTYEQVDAAYERAADDLLARVPEAERASLVTAMDTVRGHLAAALHR